MRIGIVGGGPAGLYLAYLLRRLDSEEFETKSEGQIVSRPDR